MTRVNKIYDILYIKLLSIYIYHIFKYNFTPDEGLSLAIYLDLSPTFSKD